MRHAQGFVLLKENRFDPARFLHTLQHEWGISPDEGEGITNEDGILNFNVNGLLCALSLMPAPLPDGEAEKMPPLITTGRKPWRKPPNIRRTSCLS